MRNELYELAIMEAALAVLDPSLQYTSNRSEVWVRKPSLKEAIIYLPDNRITDILDRINITLFMYIPELITSERLHYCLNDIDWLVDSSAAEVNFIPYLSETFLIEYISKLSNYFRPQVLDNIQASAARFRVPLPPRLHTYIKTISRFTANTR